MFLLVGCGFMGRARAVDLSSPQAAAMSYVKALQYGDAATAKAACTGTDEEMRWVDDMATMIRGLRELNSALYAAFGPISSQMHVDLEESIRSLADEPVEVFQNAVVHESENQARVVPQFKGLPTQSQAALIVRKLKGGWKVDLEKTYLHPASQNTLLQMSAQQQGQYFKRQMLKVNASMHPFRVAGEIFSSVAQDVQAHRFKTQAAVSQAISQRVAAQQ